MAPRGFTLIEVLITVTILGSIFFLSAYSLSKFQHSLAAQTVDRELASILSTAARHARVGVQGDSWGIYIPYNESSRLATTITLFHGDSYASRVVADDQIYYINDQARFVTVDFSGAAAGTGNDHEIVFDYLSGSTTQYGQMEVRWFDQARTLIIDPDGFIVRTSL